MDRPRPPTQKECNWTFRLSNPQLKPDDIAIKGDRPLYVSNGDVRFKETFNSNNFRFTSQIIEIVGGAFARGKQHCYEPGVANSNARVNRSGNEEFSR